MESNFKAALEQLVKDYIEALVEMDVTDPEQILEVLTDDIREELINILEENL